MKLQLIVNIQYLNHWLLELKDEAGVFSNYFFIVNKFRKTKTNQPTNEYHLLTIMSVNPEFILFFCATDIHAELKILHCIVKCCSSLLLAVILVFGTKKHPTLWYFTVCWKISTVLLRICLYFFSGILQWAVCGISLSYLKRYLFGIPLRWYLFAIYLCSQRVWLIRFWMLVWTSQ